MLILSTFWRWITACGLSVFLGLLPAAVQAENSQDQESHEHEHHGHAGHETVPASVPSHDSHAQHSGQASATVQNEHAGHAAASAAPNTTSAANAPTELPPFSVGELRDPDAYSAGFVRGSGPYAQGHYHLGDEHPYAMLLLDRLDWGKAKGAQQGALQYQVQWSWGSSYNRLLLQSEGHAQQGKLQESQNEVLWSRAATPFWNTQLGLRLDQNLQGKNRQWLAFGVEGLAPYWVEVHAKAYLGAGGRSAVQLGADYDLALSQKWYLQPSVEAHFYGQSDAANQLGSGLSSAKASLRLRYEAQRQVAPYIGVERQLSLGQTGDLVRSAGQKTGQTRWFAGLRLWF